MNGWPQDADRCSGCGHLPPCDCPHSCTPQGDAEEFARVLDDHGAEAVREGDYALADYMFSAADWWAEPSEGTRTARLMLLTAAIGREAARDGAR